MMPYHPNVVLNRNGRGFAYKVGGPERKFVQTKEVHDLVLEIYKAYRKRDEANNP